MAVAAPSVSLHLPGAEVVLLPDRAMYWPEHSALLIADVHFGKAATFRAHSIAVPGGTTSTDLQRLNALLSGTGAHSIYILGDMWHAKEGLAEKTLEVIEGWRREQEAVDITLIRGNHDRRSGPLPPSLRINEVEEPFELGPLFLAHDPVRVGSGYTLAGHIHPCVRLDGRAQQSERLPCFWFGPRVGVLPAFGSFTGCARILPKVGDKVFVLADGYVVEV